MLKKIVTIFFILLFVTQSLPIRQVGQFIAKGIMTEELPETGSSKSKADPLDAKCLFISVNYSNSSHINNNGQNSYIHFSETLPFLMASDVQTPPPNIFC
jgi:hypothetical protein